MVHKLFKGLCKGEKKTATRKTIALHCYAGNSSEKKIKAKQTNGANGWIDVEKEQASKMSQFEQDSNNLW